MIAVVGEGDQTFRESVFIATGGLTPQVTRAVCTTALFGISASSKYFGISVPFVPAGISRGKWKPSFSARA